jgi:chromosome segregation ATPase
MNPDIITQANTLAPVITGTGIVSALFYMWARKNLAKTDNDVDRSKADTFLLEVYQKQVDTLITRIESLDAAKTKAEEARNGLIEKYARLDERLKRLEEAERTIEVLKARLDTKDDQFSQMIRDHAATVHKLEGRLEALSEQNAALATENANLRSWIAQLEARLGRDEAAVGIAPPEALAVAN